MRRLFLLGLLTVGFTAVGCGPTVEKSASFEAGSRTYTIERGQTRVRLVPEAGAKVISIEHAGVEVLRAPDSLEAPPFATGVSIVYPTSNRVGGRTFQFRDMTFRFPANAGDDFRHGLVHDANWRVVGVDEGLNETVVNLELPFEPGTKHYALFPLTHVLRLSIGVRDGAVRWEYTVANKGSNKGSNRPVPFSFGIHPAFRKVVDPSKIHVTVPAEARMETDDDGLPTGELVTLDDPAGGFGSLDNLTGQRIYYGTVAAPTRIDFRGAGIRVSLTGTNEFSHTVVRHAADAPWFTVAPQTASPNAHNLNQQGRGNAALLQTVSAGNALSGSVEIRLERTGSAPSQEEGGSGDKESRSGQARRTKRNGTSRGG